MKNNAIILFSSIALALALTACPPVSDTTSDDGAVVTPVFGTPTNIAVVQSGYPNRLERTAAVYLNAARMAPLEYKAKYMSGYPMTGLLESYPAVQPVALQYDLNRAARFHSVDITTHPGTTHNSSDGTLWYTRIIDFYAGAHPTGEVLVLGSVSPLDAVNMLLYDNGKADHSFPADSSGDGHRMLIMDATARQIGAGYDGFNWTIDFVSDAPASLPPIVTACHDFLDSSTITFLLNYYDASDAGPKKISCFVDGVEQALTLDIGTAARGTYKVTMQKSSTTRAYYFMALDNADVTWRYPGPGAFMTVGEGPGTTDYVP